MRYSLSKVLLSVTAIVILFAVYDAGFRAGEISALKVPLEHHANRDLTQGELRLLAADTRKPTARCRVAFTLIGPDGGDGSYLSALSDRRGIVKLPAYLSPGRYQIQIEGHGPSPYARTSYHTDDDYLLIRPDGSYSPLEYLVNVK